MSKRDNLSSPGINDTEWDLLETLWQVERSTAREVADALEEKRGWAYSTVKTLLDRMAQKGLVDARRVGNVWEYTPAVAPTEARRTAWRRFVDTAFGGAMEPALKFLADDAKLTKRERQKLRQMLERLGDKS
jgi:BlaI family penicillinase repressor